MFQQSLGICCLKQDSDKQTWPRRGDIICGESLLMSKIWPDRQHYLTRILRVIEVLNPRCFKKCVYNWNHYNVTHHLPSERGLISECNFFQNRSFTPPWMFEFECSFLPILASLHLRGLLMTKVFQSDDSEHFEQFHLPHTYLYFYRLLIAKGVLFSDIFLNYHRV